LFFSRSIWQCPKNVLFKLYIRWIAVLLQNVCTCNGKAGGWDWSVGYSHQGAQVSCPPNSQLTLSFTVLIFKIMFHSEKINRTWPFLKLYNHRLETYKLCNYIFDFPFCRVKKIPMIIRRYLPDGSYEDWSISELIISDIWFLSRLTYARTSKRVRLFTVEITMLACCLRLKHIC